MKFTSDPGHWLLAGTLVLIYVLMCVAIIHARKRKSGEVINVHSAWLVAFASQTGTAEDLAWKTAEVLHAAGIPARVCSLSSLDADQLRRAECILFVASTYGEGGPPDNATVFATQIMSTTVPLAHLQYAALCLGDSSYSTFCGFGRSLDEWLRQQGAQALFERIQADKCAPQAINTWQQQLSRLTGTLDVSDWSNDAGYSEWKLVERRLLNPGSAGEPVYHLELQPAAGTLPDWESGDLVQVLAPGVPTDQPREYSIASIPDDGRIHLLIRLHRHGDGSFGLATGWLAVQATVGDTVKMRIRHHERFRLGENSERPLILIGNGTGMAGLRSHLKTRAKNGATSNWLIFGERNAACDFYYREDIETWQASGVLEKLDMVFSRDQAQRRYVQVRLLEVGETLRAWIEQDAAVYVCGSLQGMAGGVHQTLTGLFGNTTMETLMASGRYRRDVY